METVEHRLQVVLGSMLFQSIIKDQKIADLEKALEMEKIDKAKQTTEAQPNK
jgi:hypothetical protein